MLKTYARKMLLAFFIALSCQNFAQANNNEELVYANFRDLRDLNPHFYAGELFAQNLLFDSLIKIENDGSFSPHLAKSWKISPDGKKYVFTLRDDVVFSDGEKFNAKSAKANFDAILANVKRHGWLESVRLMEESRKNGIEPVQATGEYELTINLADAYYPFMVELGVTRPFRFISPKSFKNGGTKDGVTSMIGTGPYVLKENKIDEYSVFEVNEKYWGAKPKIKRIIAKVIPDAQTRFLSLQSGEIDLVFGPYAAIDAEAYEMFSNMPGFKTVKSKPMSTRMVLFNTTHPILKDVKVRQALMHAVDKKKFANGLFAGLETPADFLFATNVPYSNIGLKPYDFSYDKAAKLLEDAGWKKIDGKKFRQKGGKDLSLTLYYDGNKNTQKNMAELLQNEFAQVGINLIIKGEEEQAYRDRQKKADFDMVFNIAWGVPYDPQSFLGSMREPVYGDYAAQFGMKNKKKLDDTILKALKSTNEKKRQEYYTYVLKALHNEAVYLPLTYETNKAIFSDKVENVEFNISQYEVPMERMNLRK